MNHLRKLIEISSPALCAARIAVPERMRSEAGALANELQHLLTLKNGFFAFESALHVLPLGAPSRAPTLLQWNAIDMWRDAYGEIARDGVFFAEDVLGNQFLVRDQQILSFDAETGETRAVAKTFEGWAEAILDDYDHLTGYPLAHEWQVKNAPLENGDRLVPKHPFVIGGAYAVENLRAVRAERGMRWRGELARQILRLPDGASVTVKVLD